MYNVECLWISLTCDALLLCENSMAEEKAIIQARLFDTLWVLERSATASLLMAQFWRMRASQCCPKGPRATYLCLKVIADNQDSQPP